MSIPSQFGAFFRAKRKALGLTLREFCRRNGFDAGNVSRLERGLASPPQEQEGLESYAKALKIERGTDEWDTFLDLAAAETGRIPLDKQERIRKRPELLRKLRREPRGGNWVLAVHLEAWANSLEARGTLPQLVRRLVRATGKDVVQRNFPTGEQGQRPEWDGIVEAAGIDAFVPQGTSVWEMGVDKDPAKKAEADFKKRSSNSLGLNPKDTTFVFVTPRKWQKKAEWFQKKNKLGFWKEVRVYDSTNLEEWLEGALAVDAWLAEVLGQKPEGLTNIDEYWKNLQALTEPSLAPAVFLTSREDAVKEMTTWLEGPPTAIELQARSPIEVIDFFVAYSRDPLRADLLTSRSLIVEEKEAWRAMANASDQELLLIAHPSLSVEPEMVAEAVRKGHRVLLPTTETAGQPPAGFRLPRPGRSDLEKALVSCGLNEVDAERRARESAGSLSVLKRGLGRFPATTRPPWTLPENAPSLIAALLAGSWDETCEADRSALETLANRPYTEFSAAVNRWIPTPDSPLMRLGSRWRLVSRDDSWLLLAGYITADDLQRFENVALEVLGENDPAYTLPPDERWQSSILNKVLRFSPTLRTGLSETLAILSVREDRTQPALHASGRVERVLRRLLDNQDWERWASLSHLLPILAEASPAVFLSAAEKDLAPDHDEPALIKLFEQEGEPIFSSSPHTGLLWALEGLAWDRSLLTQVSLILASLHERTRPPRLLNRPLNSLKEIFLPWLPQTTANVEERVKVLECLVRKRPKASWPLLVNLLPNIMQASSPIYRPMWRDLPRSWKKGVTNAEYWQQVSACGRALVANMGVDLGRWKDLIEQFENLPEPAGNEFLKRLNEFDVNTLDASFRSAINEVIRNKVGQHRRFSEAKWALPAEILQQLEKIRSRFEPGDLVQRNAWLFDETWSVEEKFDGEPEKLTELRRTVVKEIMNVGWEDLLRLAEAAPSPADVGMILAEVATSEDDKRILPSQLMSANQKLCHFALGYAWGRFRSERWDWVCRLNSDTWSDEELGRLLVNLRFAEKPWEFAAQRPSVLKYYWEHTSPFFCRENVEQLPFIITMLLQHGRPWPACNVLTVAIHQKASLLPSMIMDVLEATCNTEIDENGNGAGGDLRYKTHLLFQELQRALKAGDSRVDENRLARLEWAYVEVLDGYPALPVTLHRWLRDSADFFFEVLGRAFHSKDDPEPSGSEEFSEKQKARARSSYRLLASWHEIPGSRDDLTVDEESLRNWVRKARGLAKERGLLEICDERIGEVLAREIERAGEPWPSDAVKDALEEFGTDDMFSGFRVGIFNKRGAYNKALHEGGTQERSLAQKFHGFAEACSIEWPKTAAALRYLAQGYEENAKREDTEAQARW